MGPCPHLAKAWIGEHYSETWAKRPSWAVQKSWLLLSQEAFLDMEANSSPTTLPYPRCQAPDPMSFMDLDWVHQAPSLPTSTRGPELLGHFPGRRPGVER